MSNSTLRVFIILAVISIIGVTSTQIYWFKKAFDKQEREFKQNLNIALNETVKGILVYNGKNIFPVDAVTQLDDNYYAAMVNDQINHDVLEHYLKTEFKKLNIQQNFEYRIYDCENKELVFGGYIQHEELFNRIKKNNQLPEWNIDNYYFTVYFPNKNTFLLGSMKFWVFSSLVMLIVFIFFSYSLFVILKQKRLSEIQKDFINNISHEVNTPLSIISVSAETIKNRLNKENDLSINNYTGIILEECNKLKTQFDEILNSADKSRIVKLNLKNVDIHDLLNNNYELLNRTNKPLTIQKQLNANKHIVEVDPTLIHSVFNNLIDNAIKYSGNKINIEINTFNVDNYLVIEIIDSGIGIEQKDIVKIFNKFYRIGNQTTQNVRGFGLGLSYVQKIIKLHKGKIEVESNKNIGSTFRVYLRLKNAN